MAGNPLTKLSVPRAPAKIISTFTAEDIERLLLACQQGNGHCICRLFVSRERYPEVLRKARERWHPKRR